MNQSSWFCLCYFNKPWDTLLKIQSSNLDRMLDLIEKEAGEASAAAAELLLDAYPGWSVEKFRLSLMELWDWYEDEKNNLKIYNNYSGDNSSWNSFMGRFANVCDYLKEFLSTWDSPNPGQISPEGNTWEYFADYMRSKYRLEINPEPSKLKIIKDYYGRQKSTG